LTKRPKTPLMLYPAFAVSILEIIALIDFAIMTDILDKS
jgi:hypothetical protein